MDRFSTLEKEYSFAPKEVYTQRVEIKTPVVVRQKAKSYDYKEKREMTLTTSHDKS